MRVSILGLLLFAFSQAASAAAVTWSFGPWEIDRGTSGSVSGSFVYDDSDDSFSAVNVATTYSNQSLNHTYNLQDDLWFDDNWVFFYTDDVDGTWFFRIQLDADLDNSLSAINVLYADEGFCMDDFYDQAFLDDCELLGGNYDADVRGQQIHAHATGVVPIPAALWLFGSALAGLGWFRRKQIV